MSVVPSRRESVDRILHEISDGSDFPALSACIQEVMKKVQEEVSVQHMTNVILKDFSMTLRVLRTANSPYYNRSGRPILSISHAVAMLGVDAVRDLAGSLVLFEHFQRKSPGLKELILLSLLSANHAREIAERIQYPRREEAYLCGMFRNLGELVAAAYRHPEYQEVLRRMRQDRLSDSQACLQVLQCTYEEIGEAVAAHWKLPDPVLDSLSGPMPALAKRRYPEAETLRLVAGFGHRLTTAIYRRETRAARASVNLLLDNYGLILGLRHDDIRQIAEAALLET
ncbi:MAG: HDOD domain-containing protein, partial [Bryobacteraceae bacterium]